MLGICPFNSSGFIASHHSKDEILACSRLHWLPHWICALPLVGNEDIFMLVGPPLPIEYHEDFTVVCHLDRVEGILLPLRQGRIKLKEALLNDSDTGCADYDIAVEHEGISGGIVHCNHLYHVVPVVDLGDSMVQEYSSRTQLGVKCN